MFKELMSPLQQTFFLRKVNLKNFYLLLYWSSKLSWQFLDYNLFESQISSFETTRESYPMGPISTSSEEFFEGNFSFELIVSMLVGHFVKSLMKKILLQHDNPHKGIPDSMKPENKLF